MARKSIRPVPHPGRRHHGRAATDTEASDSFNERQRKRVRLSSESDISDWFSFLTTVTGQCEGYVDVSKGMFRLEGEVQVDGDLMNIMART